MTRILGETRVRDRGQRTRDGEKRFVALVSVGTAAYLFRE